VILAVLARRVQPVMPPSIATPAALRLKIEPAADCGRYDGIRRSPMERHEILEAMSELKLYGMRLPVAMMLSGFLYLVFSRIF
jgi:hypothetical protein